MTVMPPDNKLGENQNSEEKKTPYEKAQARAEKQNVDKFCVQHDVCPTCGEDLEVTGKGKTRPKGADKGTAAKKVCTGCGAEWTL